MILAAAGFSSLQSFSRLLGVLLIFAFVLVITYFCTRWLARYQKGLNPNRNIRVLETFRVTNNKFIQIVEIGKVCLAIAICKDTITVLCQLNEEDLDWKPTKDGQGPGMQESFQDVLMKLKGKIPRK